MEGRQGKWKEKYESRVKLEDKNVEIYWLILSKREPLSIEGDTYRGCSLRVQWGWSNKLVSNSIICL